VLNGLRKEIEDSMHGHTKFNIRTDLYERPNGRSEQKLPENDKISNLCIASYHSGNPSSFGSRYINWRA
jgi:hypothetical protein